VALARAMGDSALFVRAAAGLIGIDGDDALAQEARLAVDRIMAALPEPDMRLHFESAEPTRLVLRYSRGV
jgi:hypothetical protein